MVHAIFCAVVECTPADRWFDAWEGNIMSRKALLGLGYRET